VTGKLKSAGSRLLRVWTDVLDDRLLDWAAALTYYAMLSLFPGILVLVTLLGVIGDSVTQSMIANLPGLSPPVVRDIIEGAISGVQSSSVSSGVFLALALGGALWSTSGYVGAFSRASGSIWHEDAGRPFWITIPIKLAITVTLLLLIVAIALIVVFTGPLMNELKTLLGLGDGFTSLWSYLRWPVLLLLMAILLTLLYTTPPDLERHRFHVLTVGSSVAIAIWVTASWLFSIYVASAASFNRVYGSLAGIIIFLIWLWISNLAVLLGLQIDAKRAHRTTETGDVDA